VLLPLSLSSCGEINKKEEIEENRVRLRNPERKRGNQIKDMDSADLMRFTQLQGMQFSHFLLLFSLCD
jgi:hypothetical protein